MIPFPDKRYDIIYADPPWLHCGGCIDRGGDTGNTGISTVARHYPTMSFDELCQLPLARITNNDCLLFLWVTSPNLDIAMNVGQVWGFKYITVGFAWDKQRTVIGRYTMSQVELCLIFKRGNIPKPRGARNVRQFLSCKRGGHSEKPWEIRQRITEMFPTQSKIELFARVNGRLFPPMEGWDYWGNEA